MNSDIEALRALAERQQSELLKRAEIALRDCKRVLLDSGQLEVNPPRSLSAFFNKRNF